MSFGISDLILYLQMPRGFFIAFSRSRDIQLEMWNFIMEGYVQSTQEISSQSRCSEFRIIGPQDIYTDK